MSKRCCHHHDVGDRIEPPARPHDFSSRSDDPSRRTAMRIEQMDCPAEEGLIRKKLDGMDGVYDIQFNLIQRVLTVRHAHDGLPAIVQALRSLGFEPEMTQPDDTSETVGPRRVTKHRSGWWLGGALAIALLAEMNDLLQGTPGLSLVLALLAIGLSGLTTYKKGWLAIRHRNLNINALMSIAVTGAFVLGEWPEAAMVMVLFAIAENIEARSLDRARNSVEQLLAVSPKTVQVRQADGVWHDVPADQVELGTLVRARPGERIGLDGIVSEGVSEVNQASITGESALVLKARSDTVYAGSINGMGELLYQVTAAADQTMLARIVHAVHDAQARKAPVQRFIDRFARVYTPLVCVLAFCVAVVPPLILGADWYNWVYKALVLLVIACPCALVISTPVAVVGALGAAARHGILIKGGVYLEQGRLLKWLALDKTGTLTTGQPRQLELHVVHSDVSAAQCQRMASIIAARSDHPVSNAIAAAWAADAEHVSPDAATVQNFQAIPGCGVKACVDGHDYLLGSYEWISTTVSGAVTDSGKVQGLVEQLREQGRTVTVLADQTRILAVFVVADTVRDSARDAIQDLHNLGVRTAMLSGDSMAAAQYAGQSVGVESLHAALLPHEKLSIIEQLMQQGKTGMVGDGINDAPALAHADIGFAMGVMGTDTAIETADVALMDDDLRKIPQFIRLSRATYRILIQNISIALGLKAAFLVLAIAGVATMWMAVFADVGASLIVLANSLRLFR